MPRPSLKEERRVEILDAYGRCIARHGVEGTTLKLIAEEAGLARALIRHNIGNKDDILDAFLDRYLAESTASSDELFESLPADDRIATLIEWLFDPSYTDPQTEIATNALYTAATTQPELARHLQKSTLDFTRRLEDELRTAYPAAGERCEVVATGIVALYFNFETMAPLGGVKTLRTQSEAAANLLVSALERDD